MIKFGGFYVKRSRIFGTSSPTSYIYAHNDRLADVLAYSNVSHSNSQKINVKKNLNGMRMIFSSIKPLGRHRLYTFETYVYNLSIEAH